MIDTINRLVLALLGVLLLATGAAMAAAAAGALPLPQPGELRRLGARAIDADPGLWWPIVIGGALLIAVLSTVWTLRQVVVRRGGAALSTIVIDRMDRGRTTIEAAKVAQAAAADLQRSRLVVGSSARLVDADAGRELRARIDVPLDADLMSVRAATSEVYDRVAGLLGQERVRSRTVIRPLDRPTSRVR